MGPGSVGTSTVLHGKIWVKNRKWPNKKQPDRSDLTRTHFCAGHLGIPYLNGPKKQSDRSDLARTYSPTSLNN